MLDTLNMIHANLAIYLIWVAIFSLLIGSFLNVVIYRLPLMLHLETKTFCREYLKQPTPEKQAKQFNLIWPLSRCRHCDNTLKPWHNIPVFSFLFLKGKCAYCKKAINTRYPLVEILCCLLTTYVAWHFGFSWQALGAAVFTWFLICLVFIDIDHQLLPDQLTLALLWIGLFASLFSVFIFPKTAIIAALVGYLIFWCFAYLFKTITGKEGLGGGDFKLLAALGAWLGWQMLPMIIFISALLGCVFALCWMVLKRKNLRGVPIPFGPFLAISGWVCLIWGPRILYWYLGVLLS